MHRAEIVEQYSLPRLCRRMVLLPSRFHRRRFLRGLTLVELVIVLMVLTAIAGILIPVFGTGVARRGSTSSSITNVAEIEKLLGMFANRHPRGHYPDHFDSLRGSDGQLVSYLPGNGAGMTTHELAAEEATALIAAGVTRVQQMADPPAHRTFDNYDGVEIEIAGETQVAAIAQPATLGLPQGGTYVVFGLGPACTMIAANPDTAANTAPVRFSGEPDVNPNTAYQRFGVVFQVADGSGPLNRARLVRAIGFGAGGPISTEQLVRQWYD